MSDFIVSARKYRPSVFSDVVGQSSITSTLSNAIKDNYLAQSFLFCGPRGVGKTTCARILARTINCENISSKVDACNTCESCKSFNGNQSFNIHELDAASNNSVDDIRNLIDQVRFAPQVGKYNIYIIDEVHMLSSSAFNAFLKTLEEPPSHAIFILATTEKHKIIPTILSRCQIFDFRNISVSDIILHLQYVSESEKINSEDDALNIIAHKAEGSLRDALSMFDRLVNSTDLTLTYKSVIENLNILDHDYYIKITDYMLDNDISSVMLIIEEILNNGFDGHQFIMGLANHLRDLLVCKNTDTLVLLDKGESLQKRYLLQSENCKLSFLIKALRMCSKCDIEYRLSKNQRLLIELTLLKIASIDCFESEKKNDKNEIIAFPQNNQEDISLENNKNGSIEKSEEEKIQVEIKKRNENPRKKERKIRKNSFSITGILEEKQDNNTDLPIQKSEDFDEKRMLEIWQEYTQKIKRNGKTNLYITLTSSPPTLLNNNTIELKISNDAQQKIIDENKLDLLKYLKENLQNDAIVMKIKITDEIKSNMPYTSQDKLNKMIENHPSIRTLQEKLNLDIDY